MKLTSSFASAMLALSIVATGFAGPTTTTTPTTVTTVQVGTPVADTPPPETLPIGTKAQLKNFALNSVVHGQAILYTETQVYTPESVGSFYVTGSDADDVLTQLNTPSNVFSIKTYDKTAPLYLWSSLTDKDGDALFRGNANPQTTESGGGLRLQNANLNLKMSWTIPIPIANVQSATIKHVNADGSTWNEELYVHNGKVFFPVQSAETQGTLIVGRYPQNGNAPAGYEFNLAYDIKSSTRVNSTAITGNSFAAIENHVKFSDYQGTSTTSPMVFTTSMKPPTSGPYQEIIAPPSGKISFTQANTPVGTIRPCTMKLLINCKPQQLGSIKAWAYDKRQIAADGTVTEFPATITTSYTNTNGVPYTTVNATWSIANPGNDGANGGDIEIYFEIDGFEKQSPPQQPYYGNGSTPVGGAG